MRFLSAVAAVALSGSALVTHAAEGMIEVKSAASVKDTISKFEAVAKERGQVIFARIDHAAGAKKIGATLRPTELLIFGNPQGGTPLMACAQSLGIDLPMKALAWQTADGKVLFGYTAPDKLKARHGIKDRDEVFKAMAGALLAFSEAATGAAK